MFNYYFIFGFYFIFHFLFNRRGKDICVDYILQTSGNLRYLGRLSTE